MPILLVVPLHLCSAGEKEKDLLPRTSELPALSHVSLSYPSVAFWFDELFVDGNIKGKDFLQRRHVVGVRSVHEVVG